MEYQGDLVTFGRFLRERRKALGLTQTEFGARVGWAQERVSILEHGKYGMPSLPQLCRLAAAGSKLPAEAQRRLSSRLGDIVDQMHVVEERLHDAEDQIVTVERLRASIQEQRQLMGTLLESCREL
jgi:transcriptional regulator with XRE-family HTH domain